MGEKTNAYIYHHTLSEMPKLNQRIKKKYDYNLYQGMIEQKIEEKDLESLEYVKKCAEKYLSPQVEEFSRQNANSLKKESDSAKLKKLLIATDHSSPIFSENFNLAR